MSSASSAAGGRGGLSIGQVLQALRPEFPDVSISKLRFLEAEGLVAPQRTPSGYRKFLPADVDRIRYILTAQRDFYYPLRVIRQHLDALERGLEPPSAPGQPPRIPDFVAGTRSGISPSVRDLAEPSDEAARRRPLQLSRDELLAHSGLDDDQLVQLVSYGLVRLPPGADFFDSEALLVAMTVARLAAYGLEPRHIRAVKTAADREVGLIEHVISPLRRQRGEVAAERLNAALTELSELCLTLHAALLRGALAPEP